MIDNRYVSGVYKAVLSLIGFIGILAVCGVFSGAFDFSALRYYTLLSNVLCVIYFCFAAVSALRGRETILPRLKAALIMCITVTGLVYIFLLSDITFSMSSATAAGSILLHYVTPAMSILDWILFDRKGRYTRLSPVCWAAIPDTYFILATIYGFASGSKLPFNGETRFPYFFMDFDRLGVGRVILYVLVLNAVFIGLGYAFVFIDSFLGRTGKKIKNNVAGLSDPGEPGSK